MRDTVRLKEPMPIMTAGLGPDCPGSTMAFSQEFGIVEGLVAVLGYPKAICRLGLHWDQQENRKCEQRITHGMGALKDRDKASISDWQAWSLGGPAEAGSCPNMSFRHPVLPPFLM